MNISLTPELRDFISKKLESGMYHSVSEVIREGLRLLKEQDELKQIRLRDLRHEVAVGLESLDNGEGEEYDEESLKELFAKIKADGRKQLVLRKNQAK
ncbi:MAG: type II toxin-antitoxin system ParD family antitoxin [Deltaproteobacteria bacterium]|nr:type II toxin-antitoxin system ParD family antitoxin [Deltaproteobacteria bacterium]